VKNEVKKKKKPELGDFENSSEMEVCLYFIENRFQYPVFLDSDWLIVFQKTDARADEGQINCLPPSHLVLDPISYNLSQFPKHIDVHPKDIRFLRVLMLLVLLLVVQMIPLLFFKRDFQERRSCVCSSLASSSLGSILPPDYMCQIF
jgi:hypothetical protein